MHLPSDDAKLLQQIARQYSGFPELLARLRRDELERMASASTETFPILKGRVGMLTDLLQHTSMAKTP